MPGVPRALRWWQPRTVRVVLGLLLAVGALNALVGGSYAISGAPAIPRHWLEPSGLPDYFLPGLILLVVLGGSMLTAALAVLARWRSARLLALTAGVLVLLWLAAELTTVGSFTWMQPASAVAAALIISLSRLLPRSEP